MIARIVDLQDVFTGEESLGELRENSRMEMINWLITRAIDCKGGKEIWNGERERI